MALKKVLGSEKGLARNLLAFTESPDDPPGLLAALSRAPMPGRGSRRRGVTRGHWGIQAIRRVFLGPSTTFVSKGCTLSSMKTGA